MSILWSQLHYWSRFQYWCQLHYGNLFHGGSGIGSTNGLFPSVHSSLRNPSRLFTIRWGPLRRNHLLSNVRNGRRFAELLLSPGPRITPKCHILFPFDRSRNDHHRQRSSHPWSAIGPCPGVYSHAVHVPGQSSRNLLNTFLWTDSNVGTWH